MTDTTIDNEIIVLKARLFELSELEKERTATHTRFIFLLGKKEGITETEKIIDAKIDEQLKKVLEPQKSEAPKP